MINVPTQSIVVVLKTYLLIIMLRNAFTESIAVLLKMYFAIKKSIITYHADKCIHRIDRNTIENVFCHQKEYYYLSFWQMHAQNRSLYYWKCILPYYWKCILPSKRVFYNIKDTLSRDEESWCNKMDTFCIRYEDHIIYKMSTCVCMKEWKEVWHSPNIAT